MNNPFKLHLRPFEIWASLCVVMSSEFDTESEITLEMWNCILLYTLTTGLNSYSLSRGPHTHCAPHIHTMCTVRTVYMSNEVSAITQMLKIPLGPLSSRGSVHTGNYGFSSLGQILLLHKHCPRAGRVCISWKVVISKLIAGMMNWNV